jgi:predicted MFS family arabinose efflux permease
MSSQPNPSGAFSGYQKFVVAVLAFMQFTIVLDFVMLSPLGALLVPALRITPSQFGFLVSAYAFSAGASGILTAGFADRFDRKKLLMFFYCGFVLGTLLCGIAWSYPLLLVARIVTGLFAGVIGSVSFAIVTDLFALEMRGRVMGIPTALFLSTRWGWNAPFFMIVAVGTVVGCVIQARMLPVAEHLKQHPDRSPVHHLLQTISNRSYMLGFLATGLLSVGGFMLMPFMSQFMVHNVGIPLTKLPLLYMITGSISVVTGPLIGRASDAFGKLRVFAFGCAVTIVMVVIYTHLSNVGLATLAAVMVLLQVGIFSRMISASALMSALPKLTDRGSYMSISSSLQQVAGGVAAMVSGLIVVQEADGRLEHYDILGYILICTTLITLSLIYVVNGRIARAAPSAAAVLETAA